MFCLYRKQDLVGGVLGLMYSWVLIVLVMYLNYKVSVQLSNSQIPIANFDKMLYKTVTVYRSFLGVKWYII